VPQSLDFDPLAPETLRDPYPAYARLRARGRVMFWERLGAWLVTRHAECLAVYRDPQRFASDPRRAGRALPDSALNIQVLDPPEHARLRHLMVNAARAQDLDAIEARATAAADARIEGLRREGGGDVLSRLAVPLALGASADFLGVPAPDPALFGAASDAIVASMDAGLDPSRDEPGRAARAELSRLVATWFEPPPERGFIAALAAQARGQGLAPELLHNSVRVAFHAGYTSAFSALGNAVHRLALQLGDWSALRAGRRLDVAAEELLRFDGPVQVNQRLCALDVELGGARLERGQAVLLMLGSANRDPEAFERPDELWLERDPNPHLAFGWGAHACLGSALARRVMRVALSRLALAARSWRLAGPVEHKAQATQRCLARLPLEPA
jgi:hypothetical protein